jgi:outer membrane protein assembly factor BamA
VLYSPVFFNYVYLICLGLSVFCWAGQVPSLGRPLRTASQDQAVEPSVAQDLQAGRVGAAFLDTQIPGARILSPENLADTGSAYAPGHMPSSIVIKSSTPTEYYATQVRAAIARPHILEKISYHADCVVQQAEFDYLTALRKGEAITAQAVINAVGYLLKKNKFETITLEITPSSSGISLHIELASFVTFGRLKIKGLLTDKQKYSHCYLMEYGDRFEQERHDYSIKKMKQLCKDEGYCDVSIESVIRHDSTANMAHPTLTITRGKQFVISDIDIHIEGDGYEPQPQEFELLRKSIEKNCFKRVIKAAYQKELLNQKASAVKDYLAREGYVPVAIVLDEQLDALNKKVRLVWHITIQHRLVFLFSGNRFFSDKQLRELVIQFGQSASLLPPHALAQDIERMYKEKGFWAVKIAVTQERDRALFSISEGSRAYIERVEIRRIDQEGGLAVRDTGLSGASAAPQSSVQPGIVPLIDTRVMIKKCFKAAYFDQKIEDASFALMRDWYEKQGFKNMRILGHTYKAGSQLQSYVLSVSIEEGAPKQDLEREDKVREPKNSETKNSAGKDTELRFGKTVVQGALTYPFDRVMRELQYEQGDVWSQQAVKKTFLQFKKRTVFDEIYVRPDKKKAVEATGLLPSDLLPSDLLASDLLVRLRHDDPCEVRLRTGLGLQNVQRYQTFGGLTYKLGGSFLFKNPTNRGDLFAVDADFSRSHRELVGKYTIPWFCGLPVDGIVQAYGIRHYQPGFIGNKQNIYRVAQQGALMGLYRKSSHGDAGLNMGFEWMRTKLADTSEPGQTFAHDIARAIDFNPRLQNRLVPFFFVEPTLYIDRLDDKFNPHAGWYSLMSMKGMIPLHEPQADSFFVKFLAEYAYFKSLFSGISRFAGDSCVLALRARVGHIFYQQFNAIMPTERFYLGGSHSMRGYDPDAAPPLGVYVDSHGHQQAVPRGGKTMLNGNVELRVPLVSRVGGVVFQDLGLLRGDSWSDIRAKDLLASSGFGLRFNTPVGPLRFDIGFNWRKHHELESRYSWSLSFGQAF